MLHICEACGKKGASKRCSRCMEAIYCSTICQRQHWKAGHKHKCVPAEKQAIKTVATLYPGGGFGNDEECTICLDALQQPQTMPCGHRFCRQCVASMRRHGATVAQVCPLCRGAMPDSELLRVEAMVLLTQYQRWMIDHGQLDGKPGGAALSVETQRLVGKAAELSREALAIDSTDALARILLGYALLQEGDEAGAEAAWCAAIAADPQNAMAHFNMGVLLTHRGDLAGAEAAWRATIAADPQNAKAHFTLGLHLQECGDLAGAEAAYRATIAADSQEHFDKENKANAHFNLGILLIQREDFAGAEAAWYAAIAIDPQHASAKRNLGIMRTCLQEVLGQDWC